MKSIYKTWFMSFGVGGWICILISIIFALMSESKCVLVCYNEFNEIYIDLILVIGVIIFMIIYIIKKKGSNEV